MKEAENENQCSICLGILDKEETTARLECGHRFHNKCIRRWIETARRDFADESCPNCRQPINFKYLSSSYQSVNDQNQFIPQVYVEPRRHSNNNLPFDFNPRQLNQENNYQENPNRGPNDCSSSCILFLGIIALIAEGLILYFYILSCGTLFTTKDLPAFSAGMNAKGYIAVGMFAEGIVAIGMIGQGIFTISMVGTGLLFFFGQVGGGFGFGIYQVGISWFCKLGQLSIGLWSTEKAQIGVSLISPFYYPQRRHMVTCE